ncbi:AMP-binding protein [Nocardioides flavescens]|uniref:AMP-binding protein n=1 Tax=Nocardioides flavescens TaxID=2691959 RepID=UPI00136B24A1
MSAARSFAEAVRDRAELDPDAELVCLVGGPSWSAGRLWGRACELAAGLAAQVGPGDAVLTAVEPSPETVALTTALSMLGAVEVACPSEHGPRDVRRLARVSRSRLAVVDPVHLTEHLEPVVLASTPVVVTRAVAGHLSLDDLAAHPQPLPRHDPHPGTPALAVPTSGTTGRPKIALLPNGAALGQARRVQRAMGYDDHDVVLSVFPWQHINARHAAFLPAVLGGARSVVAPRFSASRFWADVTAEGVTAFNFMGAVCAILLRRPPGPLDRAHLVERAYGGPAPAWLVEQVAERFGVELRQAYACTELGDVATTGDQIRPGAAGRVVPEYDAQVRDEHDRTVPDGTVGALVVRPREEHLTFAGYLDDPAATDEAWRGGWFRTGDRARLEDGWLWFEGRGTDVIRRRGLNISAASVEDAVAAYDGVAEVAAVAVPSELTEDEVLVVVVPTRPDLDPAALVRHCRGVLPRHAVPRYVSVEDSLPRNANHKVLHARLRDRGLPPTVWDAERSPSATLQENP